MSEQNTGTNMSPKTERFEARAENSEVLREGEKATSGTSNSEIGGSRDLGDARMVQIGEKAETRRRAVARAVLRCRRETIILLREGTLPKGNALETARIAGIMAAKNTPGILPLCHPLALTAAKLDFDLGEDTVEITAVVETVGRTGVEMEALTAAAVAGLTIYDMAKSVDRWMEITSVALEEKEGGRSGHWHRPLGPDEKTGGQRSL